MKRGYVTYLVVGTVLCIVGTVAVYRIVGDAQATLAAVGADPGPPALTPEQVAAHEAAAAQAHAAAAARAAARKADQEQAARIAAELAKLAIPGPGEALLPKPPSHIIVEFTPEAAAGLDIEGMLRTKRYACYSFMPDPASGKRLNRCIPVGTKPS